MLSHINKDAPFYDYVITKTKKTTVKRKKITITHTPKDNNIDRNNKSITRTKTTQTTTKTETLVKQTLKKEQTKKPPPKTIAQTTTKTVRH